MSAVEAPQPEALRQPERAEAEVKGPDGETSLKFHFERSIRVDLEIGAPPLLGFLRVLSLWKVIWPRRNLVTGWGRGCLLFLD